MVKHLKIKLLTALLLFPSAYYIILGYLYFDRKQVSNTSNLQVKNTPTPKSNEEVKNEEKAISIVMTLPEVKNFIESSNKYGEKTKILAEKSEVEDTYTVQVFTDLTDHLNTFKVYQVNILTLEIVKP